jgi:hypothetical protein
MATRFTRGELRAIRTALAQTLAGPLDGHSDDEETAIRPALESALVKVNARLGAD